MRSVPFNSAVFCFVVYTLLVGSSISFHIGFNPAKLQTVGLNSTPKHLNKYRSTPLYQDLKGSKVDVAAMDKIVDTKAAKAPFLSPKVIISAVISVIALSVAAATGGFSSFDFDASGLLERSLVRIESLGPYGYLYFALVSALMIDNGS